MTDDLKAAILNARSATLNAEIAGMVAENQHRISCGESIAYGKEAFDAAIEANGLGYNGITLVAIHGEYK